MHLLYKEFNIQPFYKTEELNKLPITQHIIRSLLEDVFYNDVPFEEFSALDKEQYVFKKVKNIYGLLKKLNVEINFEKRKPFYFYFSIIQNALNLYYTVSYHIQNSLEFNLNNFISDINSTPNHLILKNKSNNLTLTEYFLSKFYSSYPLYSYTKKYDAHIKNSLSLHFSKRFKWKN